LRKSFNGVGNPIPKEMSVKPMWDNAARVIHSLGFNNYKLSHDAYNIFRDFQFWIHEYKEQPDESFGYGMMTTLGKLEPLNDFRKIIGMNLCITPSSLSLLIAFLITRGCTEPNNETAIFSQYVLPLECQAHVGQRGKSDTLIGFQQL
jgi:hypothetical protein